MFTLIGNGPDFVMRQGLVEVFHKGVVRAVDSGGMEKFHESTSDRSLWVVAKVVAGYLTANDIGLGDINRMVFAGWRAEIIRSGRTIEVSLKLPHEIPSETQANLVDHFSNFIEEFIKMRINPHSQNSPSFTSLNFR
jgi:hypothetical protein